MQSKRFGVAWLVHQSLPSLVSENNCVTESARESLLVAMYALSQVMPCKFCRRSYRHFVYEAALNRLAAYNKGVRAQDFENVLFDIHNRVNEKLGKPHGKQYKKTSDAKELRCALLDWLSMIAINYGKFDESLSEVRNRTRLNAALRQICAHSSERGSWLRQSALARRDFFSFVNRDENDDDDDDAWTKIWWHILYIDALSHLCMSVDNLQVQQCGRALRREFFSHCENGSKSPFTNSVLFFRALFNVRHKCVHDCESFWVLRERFESYRAAKCKDNVCD